MARQTALLVSVLGLLLAPSLASAQAPERKLVEVAPRTPLYCEDSTHTIQPSIYGDFGDLVAAYDRLLHWPALVVSNGKRADGEDYSVLMFTAPANDPKSPHEVVGFVITRHADGYALRSVTDKPDGLDPLRTSGNDMCAQVLSMLLDSDRPRAMAYRQHWGEQHPDSTSH